MTEVKQIRTSLKICDRMLCRLILTSRGVRPAGEGVSEKSQHNLDNISLASAVTRSQQLLQPFKGVSLWWKVADPHKIWHAVPGCFEGRLQAVRNLCSLPDPSPAGSCRS